MEQNFAAEHLQVIRTLMERSALYRRALAPIMLFVGSVGVLTAIAGSTLGIDTPRGFYAWWLCAAVVAVAGAFVIVRRQALRDREPFWSPPTWRIAHAILTPLTAGLLLSLALLVFAPGSRPRLFVLADALFYGCAVNAASFFMPRGMKLFGWLIVGLAGLGLFTLPWSGPDPFSIRLDHALMGGVFGVLHLVYAFYLYAAEARKASS